MYKGTDVQTAWQRILCLCKTNSCRSIPFNVLTVKQQWKVGSYNIDIVAIYGDKKVAIECDGKTSNYTEAETITNLKEQEVLERCGWEFIRVRASQYFRNPDKAIKELILQLEEKGIYPNNKEIQSNRVELLDSIKAEALELMEKYEEN